LGAERAESLKSRVPLNKVDSRWVFCHGGLAPKDLSDYYIKESKTDISDYYLYKREADMPRPPTARDRILRYLLGGQLGPHHRGCYGTLDSMYALWKASEVPSCASVHETLGQLIAEGQVDPDDPTRIKHPPSAYRWWAGKRAPPKAHSLHVSSPLEAAAALEAAKIPNAVTTYYAENAWASHLFPRRFDTYVKAQDVARARNVLLDHGAQLGGSNFRLLTSDAHLLKEAEACRPHYPGTPYRLAPLPQVIVDLLQERGSPVEAAELLMAFPEPIPPLDPKSAKSFQAQLKKFRMTEKQLASYRAELARRGSSASD
jgi:hypothetical protein